MKRLICMSVAVALLGGTSAFAADAVVYEPPMLPQAEIYAPFSWAGSYIGLHAGYGWGKQRDNQSVFFPPDNGSTDMISADRFNMNGFIGGIHLGHNWQNGSFVFGLEGDLDYANIDGSTDFDYWPWGPTGHLSMKSNWQGAARLRVGYAVDTWLFFATGGLAFAHAKMTASGAWPVAVIEEQPENRLQSQDVIMAPGGMSASDSNIHVGWTVGLGIEKAFTPNWVGRIEGRYTDFGSKTYNLGPFGDNIKSRWHQATILVGFSYKF